MTCPSGKVMHATRDEALEMQKRLVWSNHVRGRDDRSALLHVYPCEGCSAWHVGHSTISTPTVYHYDRAEEVISKMTDTVALLPAKPRRMPKDVRRKHTGQLLALYKCAMEEREPLVWFSWNAAWDCSGAPHPGSFVGCPVVERKGLLRIGVPASVATLRWSDYLTRNRSPRLVRRAFEGIGNPAQWLATDRPVPLVCVRSMEIWHQGAWMDVNSVSPDELDAVLGADSAGI